MLVAFLSQRLINQGQKGGCTMEKAETILLYIKDRKIKSHIL